MMKIRKVILLTLIFTLICGSAVYADTVTQKLRVWFNNKEADDAGVVVDGKTFLSIRTVTDKLQALLSWDDTNKKLTIYKPNVHMITMSDGALFGGVTKAKSKFLVLSQIDNLKVDISAFKVTISDPYNEVETLIDQRDSTDKDFPDVGKEDFWFKSKDISYNFDIAGKYTVRFWIKLAGDSTFQVVSEKIIKRQ
jgi:hypothetical protein